MGEVIAGWAAGYSMSIFSTFALVYLLVKGSHSRFVLRYTNGEMNALILSIPASLGSFFGWTMVGLMLGSAYKLGNLADQPNVLGSPSAPFLLGMVTIAFLPLPVLVLFWPRMWWLWVGMSAIFVANFGWLMPLMAEQW